MVNILKNSKDALEDSKDKKYIFISTQKENETILIKIKDNAGGIKTEYLNRIFEPYFTTKYQSNSLGLGLNIVYKIVNDSLHGKVKVRNSKYTYENIECEGAEFTITIPIKKDTSY